jgi:hypothetical protein
MSPAFERILPLVSMGYLPWSFAIIYLLAGVIRYRMSKAKPELVLVALSFIVIIFVGVLAHSPSNRGTQTSVRTGDITQQGAQNVAGVGGSVAQTSEPCDDSKAAKK